MLLRVTSEAMLLIWSLPRGGWTKDRPPLPDPALRAIRNGMGSKISTNKWPIFAEHLQLIFSATVLAETFRQQLRKGLCSDLLPKQKAKLKKSDRGKKLGTLVRQELNILRNRYAALANGSDRDAHAEFFQALSRALPASARLLEEQILEEHNIRVRRYSSEAIRNSAFPHIGGVLEELCTIINQGVTTGRSEAALEQMARALAALYHDFVGKRPGRSWLDLVGTEGGRYLDLCRIMAQAVNDALPADLRRPKAADMAKPARRMVDELKLELLQPLGRA